MRAKLIAYSVVVAIAVLIPIAGHAEAGSEDQAQEILDQTGIQGGLIVHLGCGDGKLTAALRRNNSYIVHGLDTDAKNVTTARSHLITAGLHGPVSVAMFDM
jgi:2-polyprenyl-3-methyl-5-hydroxy-6-metoxy-1,4-benzoquinol methylase